MKTTATEIKHIICYSNGAESASVAVAVVRKYGKENCILLNHGINTDREPKDITAFGLQVAEKLGMKITYANIDGITDLNKIPPPSPDNTNSTST